MRRLYPQVVGTENPFEGVLKIGGSKTKVAATRAEAYALAFALRDLGEPHLGAAALICFEWLQRPENVLTGKITWPDYRATDHPNHVRIFHHKTGQVVLQPLEDKGRKLYPDLKGIWRICHASVSRLSSPRDPVGPLGHTPWSMHRPRFARRVRTPGLART